jgi:hypothetical protein
MLAVAGFAFVRVSSAYLFGAFRLTPPLSNMLVRFSEFVKSAAQDNRS